ncbi:MAG: DNA polymerase domain-containing protein [Firmicutes bacterium]|nr:DNA polymerase domain-containing protein [Bacillota bacterium]
MEVGYVKESNVIVNGREIKLSNLDKEFWPDAGLKKAHLIKYYSDMATHILPYLKNRPLVMKRYPDGIEDFFFYQKECPSYAPDWVESFSVKHTRKIVNYIICNDSAILIWLANQGCIEMHAWLSTIGNLDFPDLAVMDLDPAEGTDFSDVVQVALLVKKAFMYYDLTSFVKTSGSSGLHIFVPIRPVLSFNEVTECMKIIAASVVKAYPEKATIERSVAKRYGKVYLDYLQNGRGKTMAFPYSLRPLPGAPISTPLRWEEVPDLASSSAYVMSTIKNRLHGLKDDPWEGMLTKKQDLGELGKTVSAPKYKSIAGNSNRIQKT